MLDLALRFLLHEHIFPIFHILWIFKHEQKIKQSLTEKGSYSLTLGSLMKGSVALLACPGVEKRALSPFTIGSDHNVNCFIDSFFWNPSDNQHATLNQLMVRISLVNTSTCIQQSIYSNILPHWHLWIDVRVKLLPKSDLPQVFWEIDVSNNVVKAPTPVLPRQSN